MSKRPSEDTSESSKRFRAAIDESTDDLSCPITHELPLDPVFAEDGNVYERTAIERWLAQQQRSPVTNLRMGTRVVAATRIKSLIERMVRSDALPEDKASGWKRRMKEQEEVEKTRRAADAGDAASALNMARWLESGLQGLAKDLKKALAYYEKAADAGDATAMGFLCSRYYYGWSDGENKVLAGNFVLALRWAAAAASLGNGPGMGVMSLLYRRGMPGLPVDEGMAFRWSVKAEKTGVLNSLGLCELGNMYARGQGTAVDMAMAEAMMRKAIAKNSARGSGVADARAWLAANGLPP